MGFLDRFRGRPKKQPPTHGRTRMGHRGIAIGSTEEGKRDLSAENIAKWKMLTADEVEDFVHFGQPLFVHSTAIAMVQFFPADEKLMIEYLDGTAGYYHPISEELAYDFARAPSKNSWVWDVCRVRGTVHEHKIPWTRIR